MRIRYVAIREDGKKETGDIEADNERQALEWFADKGWTPIQLDTGVSSVPWWQRQVDFGSNRINRAALHGFLFQLSRLLDAKLPMLEALSLLIQRTDDKHLKGVLQTAMNGVANGRMLSTALKDADSGFPAQVIAALEVGERANTLADAASQSAEALNAQMRLRNSFVGAAAYPIVLLVMSSIVLGIVLFYLLPVLEPVFAANTVPGATNPLAPLLVIRSLLLILLQISGVLLVVMVFTFPFWRKSDFFSRFWDRVPVLGSIRRDARSQFAAATLASLLSSGSDLSTAISVAASTARNKSLKSDLQKIHSRLLDGDALAKALDGAASLDPMVQQLALLGEKSEQLPNLMQVAASLLETSMKRKIERMLALLVPTLTIIVGLVVGTMVLLTMNAVLSVNQLAQ